jgi:hypothetical protein
MNPPVIAMPKKRNKVARSLRITSSRIRTIAFLGNYLPRKCGIATFTSDLLPWRRAADFATVSVPPRVVAAGAAKVACFGSRVISSSQ